MIQLVWVFAMVEWINECYLRYLDVFRQIFVANIFVEIYANGEIAGVLLVGDVRHVRTVQSSYVYYREFKCF